MKSEANCQNQCTALDVCIAYGVGKGFCILVPSTPSCPQDWKLVDGKIATQSSDITISSDGGITCMAKGRKHMFIL